jgi:hypothetical protein
MIKTSSKQTGSAHVVIIVILIIALISTLGFVFWQNFIAKDDKVEPIVQTSAQKGTPKEIVYKTYQTDIHPISFKYQDTWSLENAQANDQYAFSRSVDVETDKADKISFSVGGQGIGGTCGPNDEVSSNTIDIVPTSIKAAKPVTLSFTVLTNKDGGYDATYGLTDSHTKLAEEQTCLNTFYYLFDSGNSVYKLMSFTGTKHFENMNDAKKFLLSDEYSAIKKMILTLNY